MGNQGIERRNILHHDWCPAAAALVVRLTDFPFPSAVTVGLMLGFFGLGMDQLRRRNNEAREYDDSDEAARSAYLSAFPSSQGRYV